MRKLHGSLDLVWDGYPGFESIDFGFSYCYSPASPPVFYLRNGDPGYPGEPAELEVFDIVIKSVTMNGVERKPTIAENVVLVSEINRLVDLGDEPWESIETAVLDRLNDMACDYDED
jgi:hypothetical protein